MVLAAWRENTQCRYEAVITQWEDFCSREGCDPIYIPVSNMINFMAERYTDGTGYRTACLNRSALNSYVTITEGMTLTDHPLVRRFVAGVFNTRPPMPRYVQVWDIGIVISYLRGLGETPNLSLKLLTLKLNALLSIPVGQL